MEKWDKYRKNKDNNQEEKNTSKTNINWYIPTLVNSLQNRYK